MSGPGSGQLAIAHRTGNDLGQLAAAAALGVDYAECDLWWFHGRVEVRHLKTVGPAPIFWDRWYLANPFAPRLRLEALLGALPAGLPLLFDLKGGHRALPRALLKALAAIEPAAPYAVCSQWWGMLAPFHALPGVQVFYSVGDERALARLRGIRPPPNAAISIHERLLTRERVAALHESVPVVAAWPVATLATYERLRAMDVDGFITENTDVLRAILDARRSPWPADSQ